MIRILLVDDDPAIREVLKAYLQRDGYEVLEASDGEKVLELAPRSNLVILDLMLPEVDGWEVARVLKRDHPELPLLMLTARGSEFERGHRLALRMSFLSALPLAMLLAMGTSCLESRRVASVVQRLARASRKVAEGQYDTRVQRMGQDELGDLADTFNELAIALGNAEKERLELIAIVAHELRTPLASLQGYAEGLADGVIPAEVAIRAIRNEARSLRRMAHDLLLITRVDSGTIEIEPSAQAPADLLREAYDRFGPAFETNGVDLVLELPEGVPRVWADADRVEQVLSNLLE